METHDKEVLGFLQQFTTEDNDHVRRITHLSDIS